MYAPAHTQPCWGRSLFLSRTIVVTALLLTTALPGHGGAGIATDGSVGVRQTIAGANAGAGLFVVPQALGTVAGNNLFHSFSTFNIDIGQTARFTTSTPTLANVISRVSGGSASQINGLLQLTAAAGSTPAFFFINPAGVIFGAGAAIDVPGAFHVTSADYLTFGNGDRFHASLAQGSALSIAAPQAFGFLGATRATVVVKDGAALAMKPTQPISIVAGDIEINNGSISTQGGDIRVLALGQMAQEVGFADASSNPNDAVTTANGNLSIFNGGGIISKTFSSNDAGNLKVMVGTIAIDGQGSGISTGIYSLAAHGSTGRAGNVDITATGNLSLRGGEISSDSIGLGDAGMIRVRAGDISIDRQGSIGPTGIFSLAACRTYARNW